MTIGKRLISIILACSMILGMSATAFANTGESTNYSQEIYTVDQNGNIYYTEVLEELTDEDAVVISDKTRASATMDQYISNIVVNAQNGMSEPTITYTVKMQIPTGVNCYLGYEFPSGYGKVGKMVGVMTTPGSYTIKLGAPNFIGKYNFKGKLTARDYSEYKELKTVTFYPTKATTTYHEVTGTEVNTMFLLSQIPGIYVNFNPTSRLISIVAKTFSGWGTVAHIFDINSAPIAFTPKKGNYIKTVSTYSSTGLAIGITVYRSKTDSVVEHTSTVRYNFR